MSAPNAERLDLSVIPADNLRRASEAWEKIASSPARELLRLDLLRTLARTVHAERSRTLASTAADEQLTATKLRDWEARLENLRQLGPLDGELSAALLGSGPTQSRKNRVPPAALESALSTEKLARYDRQWEAALTCEACAAGWNLWTFDAWVEIARAEEWNSRLTSHLWPSGIVLFVETGPTRATAASRSSGPVPLPLWPGHWTIAIRPDIASPDHLSGDSGFWPGHAASPPEPPRWKLLFLSKSP